MGLTEQNKTKIEIVGNEAYRTFQIREDRQILDDGVVISQGNYTRFVLEPGSLDGDTYTRTDTTGYSQEIQDLTSMCWTEAAYTAHEAYLRAQS